MKYKKTIIGVALFVALVVAALLPAVLPDHSSFRLVGPDLSFLEYEEIEFENGKLQFAGMLFTPDGEGPIGARYGVT